MLAIFGANVINMTMANSAAPAPNLTGTDGADGVSERASITVPSAIMAIQAGELRYIQIANNNWNRLIGFRPGMRKSCQYCILPWHQRRSRRLNSISVRGFSFHPNNSNAKTKE